MIAQFKGEYRWLSNFAPCKIILDEREYLSVEHAYMSEKSDEVEWKVFCMQTDFAGTVKSASRKIKLVPGWETLKIKVMRTCLEQKFSQEPYRTKLIETGNKYIQEGTTWGDTFWGVDLNTGEGKNLLGLMIMDIRKSLL